MEKTVSKKNKILSIVLGALIGGFMWRCRGESGWGSSWGLYSVGLVLILLIYQFYGKKRNMKFELIPVGALLTGLGVTGYATVIEQMSGTLYSDLPYGGPDPVNVPIDPYSGMVIILLMGFTLVPLFSFFIGTLFSKKEYKVVHYIIAIGIFFAVSYIVKATFSHYILKLINPEQVEYAALGLKECGYDYSSPMQAYMTHFGNRRWTQEIPFFENYYMSIEHISDVFAVIAVALYPLIAFKDKITSLVTAFISFFTGISTTALSLLIVAEYDSGILADVTPPISLTSGAGWGIWEFATGAAVGFFTMLIIALLPSKYTSQSEPDVSPFIGNKKLSFLFNMAATIFVFGVVPARVIGIRLGKLFENVGIMEDGDTLGTVTLIVIAVILGVFLLIKLIKNMLKADKLPLGVNGVEFAFKAFPAYTVMCSLAYFFLNHACLVFVPYAQMTSLSNVIYVLSHPGVIATTVMFFTFVIFEAIYIPVRKKLKKSADEASAE